MPRFLFHVDQVSRERTSLTHAVLYVSDEEWMDILAHVERMRELRTTHRAVAELRLHIEPRWYTQPPFGDETARLDPSGTAAQIGQEPIAPGVSSVDVEVGYVGVDDQCIVLECNTLDGLVARTEGLELGKGVRHAPPPVRVRAWDDVEWGLVVREVDGVETTLLTCGVWFVMGASDVVPTALSELSDERSEAIRELVDRLRAAIQLG